MLHNFHDFGPIAPNRKAQKSEPERKNEETDEEEEEEDRWSGRWSMSGKAYRR